MHDRLLLAVLVLVTAGCAGGPVVTEADWIPQNKTERLQDPEKVWGFLVECVQARHWSWAHKTLEPGTMAYEEFYFAFASRPLFQGIIGRSEMHAGPEVVEKETRRIEVCNADYAFCESIELVLKFGKIWTVRIPEAQKERMVRYALDAWEGRNERTGDFFIFSRGLKPPPRGFACPHEDAP